METAIALLLRVGEQDFHYHNVEQVVCLECFSVIYVGERPWWPVKSPNKGRKKKVKG